MPISKKGDKQICSNYRPISKLSVKLDKIFEEVLLRRLKTFIETNKIIDDRQFGFVKGSNITAACLKCVEIIYENIDKKKYVGLVSIDL